MFGILAQKKKCSACGEWKLPSEFHKHKGHKDGLSTTCKKCAIEATSKWQKENPDRVNEKIRKWSSENRERKNQWNRRWAKNNPERVRELQTNWRILNPRKVYEKFSKWAKSHKIARRLNEQKRRSRKNSNGGTITEQEWINLLEKYGHKCLCCERRDVKLTLDHVVPLEKGGLNIINNAQPLCGSCNSKKGTKIIDYR